MITVKFSNLFALSLITGVLLAGSAFAADQGTLYQKAASTRRRSQESCPTSRLTHLMRDVTSRHARCLATRTCTRLIL